MAKHNKVDNPSFNYFLIKLLIFEWNMVWCGSKNGNLKDMCLKEIGLRAQNMMFVLSSNYNQHEFGGHIELI